jgi:two-component system, OmpR family, phosphate regulon sensor histidine kinase PhoR
MTDLATWKSLCYLLVKFPFGIFSFTLTVTLLTTSIAIILSPLSYLITTLLVAVKTIPANTLIHVGPYGSILIDGQFRLSSLLLSLIGTMVGISLLYISRIILNFVAYLWGEFARMMLGRQRVTQPMEAREFEGRSLD